VKYHVAHIETSFREEWQADVFEQQLFDLGFDTIDAGDCYIPSELWSANSTKIEKFISETEGATLKSVEACPDENWNAVWESSHPVQELALGIRIVPHCAFGAGHHETTSMMTEALQKADLAGKAVLDHGTGTGVLAIFAKRLGAAHVTAVDIDEKSVENAKENAELNAEEIEVLLNHTVPKGQYDLILANIHRNVLISNMDAYAAHTKPGGELWLSGFYEEDCPILKTTAESHGFCLSDIHASNEWRMLQFVRQ
jgi:ribosomal protein L11 methyltransferase